MSLKLLEKPAVEPVTLEEMKNFLHLEHDIDDELLKILITTGRELVEKFLGRSLIRQKWLYVCVANSEHVGNAHHSTNITITLPLSPIIEICKVKLNGFELTPAEFRIVCIGEVEVLLLQPNATRVVNGIQISTEFIAGYGELVTDIPGTIKLGIMMVVAKIYKERDLTPNEQEIFSGIKCILSPFKSSLLT